MVWCCNLGIDYCKKFRDVVVEIMDRILSEEKNNIDSAAKILSNSILHNGFIYVFGTGHSMSVALDLFYRAGGLVRVFPIVDISLSVLNGALKSSLLERLSGYAKALLASITIKPESTLLIISNSGKNTLPVELAIEARSMRLKSIGITSVSFSKSIPPENPLGKKLYEVVDIVIDNKVPEGDAAIEIEGLEVRVAPVSTIINSFIVQMLTIKTIEKLLEKGIKPEVWVSANIPGGIEKNKLYIEKYMSEIKPL